MGLVLQPLVVATAEAMRCGEWLEEGEGGGLTAWLIGGDSCLVPEGRDLLSGGRL